MFLLTPYGYQFIVSTFEVKTLVDAGDLLP
ncbi:hypothetical protein IL54_3347 [Sphingobium sp. ba1]|nr:hypothetical protein IL54_3347 [Sphingobium sp. ba1]